jgi:hypothetical protein
MNARTQRWCAWSGMAFCALFCIGFVGLAHLVPPPSPNDSARQVMAFYSARTNWLRSGLLVAMFGCALMIPFVTVVSAQMRRIEGRVPVLAAVQFGAGLLAVLIWVLPLWIMLAAAYRPARDPEVTQALHDSAWLIFLGCFCLVVVQALAVAVAVFSDERQQPVFPRWVGYVNIYIALSYVPTGLTVFVKTGPLAWPGILVFWIPAATFFGWYFVMFAAVRKAIDQEEHELAAAAQTIAPVAARS